MADSVSGDALGRPVASASADLSLNSGDALYDAPPPRVLIYAMNYAPELIGCGKYTGEIGAYLAAQGTSVEVVTTAPHYPSWQAQTPYSAGRYTVEKTARTRVTRCPIGLNKKIHGFARAWAPLSFALSSAPVVVWRILTTRPNTVFCVEPTLLAAPAALLAAKLVGARTVLHVQDLEMDAAFAMGHVRGGFLKNLAFLFEKLTLKAFDHVITISHKMRQGLQHKGLARSKISIVRNWVDLARIFPMLGPNAYRRELGIDETTFVALYSGSIGAKQALDVVAGAAESLVDREDILFVIAGDGPAKAGLVARGLKNMRFMPLQPEPRLCELLNLADAHLLPQDHSAADLVLPSKLAGMLATGKPIVAQAKAGTELHSFLDGACSLVKVGDSAALAEALLDLRAEREKSTQNAEKRRALAEQLSAPAMLRRLTGAMHRGRPANAPARYIGEDAPAAASKALAD
ncbi:MAG: WcaI family glycosyltransferase [Terricaulis sp.]